MAIFPHPYICLIDNDCAPTVLFEMQELSLFCARDTLLRGSTPNAPGLALVTEPHFELNAGMLIAAPAEHTSPLHDVDSLPHQLAAEITQLPLRMLGSTIWNAWVVFGLVFGGLLRLCLGCSNHRFVKKRPPRLRWLLPSFASSEPASLGGPCPFGSPGLLAPGYFFAAWLLHYGQLKLVTFLVLFSSRFCAALSFFFFVL